MSQGKIRGGGGRAGVLKIVVRKDESDFKMGMVSRRC